MLGMSTSLTPQKETIISVINGVCIQGQVEKFLALIPPRQKPVESRVAVLPHCHYGLDDTGMKWSMRKKKQCCSSHKHLIHREALQGTMRKADIKQAFIFISHQRFCPAHCYLSDESLSFHSLSLLCFLYIIYIKCLLFLQNFIEKNSLFWCCNKALYICLCCWCHSVGTEAYVAICLVERDDTMLNAKYLESPAPAVLQRPWWLCLLPLAFAFDGVWLQETQIIDYPEPTTTAMGYVKFCSQGRKPPARRPSGSVLRSKYIPCASVLTPGFIPCLAWPELDADQPYTSTLL